MTNMMKARENELVEFANKCKAAGLRVFFSEWKHSVGRKEYFHVSDGKGVAYVSNSDINFGYFTLGLVYKPSKGFGAGCNLRDWQEWKNPQVQDVINACAMRKAPSWVTERVNNQRLPWTPIREPSFYKDVDEWIASTSKFCKIVEL